MMDKPARTISQTTPGQLVWRILQEPGLLDAVRLLPARALGKLIDHVGLEDCGELVSLATTEQLREVFDDDLWHSSRPGAEETFDADRFLLWLEVMLEVSERFAADKLAELPEELVTLALDQHLLVVDVDALALEMSGGASGDFSLTDKALQSCLYYELDAYQVIARRGDGWDAMLSLLVELHARHHDLLGRLLRRCCHMSTEVCERAGGLYNVLTSAEMLQEDVAGDREDRRTARGYVAPTAAASFLALARTTALPERGDNERDPITRAYFRSIERAASTAQVATKDPAQARIVEMLREADILEDNSPVAGLLGGSGEEGPSSEELLGRCLAELSESAPEVFDARREELAYLANLLVAGCSVGGGRFRPVEAARAAVAVCNLALQQLADETDQQASTILLQESADRLFRFGWQLLDQLSLEVAMALAAKLDDQPDKRLRFAARAIRQAVAAGKPWQERRRLDPVGPLSELFEADILEALQALIDEYPMLAGVLTEGPPQHISTVVRLRGARELLSQNLRTTSLEGPL